MSGDFEIGGTPGRRVAAKRPTGSRKAEPKRTAFTRERQERFLAVFAATCNARFAAEEAGVGETSIYYHRRKNPEFAVAWEAALQEGYARLEAELVRAATQSLTVKADEELARSEMAKMDAKTALAVLENYRRSLERRVGNISPRAADLESVRCKLEREMQALRIIDAKGELLVLPAPAEAAAE